MAQLQKNESFKLFGRNLNICWGEDKRYWSWPFMKDTKIGLEDTHIEVAELLDVCWLDIKGKFDTSYLSEGTHEVVFVVKLKENRHGWEHPVTLKLELPNGKTQEQKVCLKSKPTEQWFELKVGDVRKCDCENKGEMQFSLFEHTNEQWKKGLVVKGAVIRNKKVC